MIKVIKKVKVVQCIINSPSISNKKKQKLNKKKLTFLGNDLIKPFCLTSHSQQTGYFKKET